MTIKDQLNKLKENWLLVTLVLLIVVYMAVMSEIIPFGGMYSADDYGRYDSIMSESAVASKAYYPAPYYGGSDFAPEVQDRLITKNAYMTSEVKQGTYMDADAKLKSIIKASDAYLLNENVNKNEAGWKAWYTGYYSIKVESKKYDAVVSQLKEIGEVKAFNENAQDITGQYTDLQSQLKQEQDRLTRYKQMYAEAILVADKITLSDRIADQERTIQYYENAIDNMDKQVSYSTISVTLSEKQSEYANIAFVKLSALVSGFVESLNKLLSWVIYLVPWALAFLIGKWAYNKNKKRK